MPSVFSNDKSVLQTYFDLAADTYPGIYLSWEPLTSDDFGLNVSPVDGEQVVQRIYSVSKSPRRDGDFVEIGRVQVPDNEFLDEFGKPEYYYKITLIELNLSNASETQIAVSGPLNGEEQLIKTSLAYELQGLLDRPVYDDEIVFNSDRTRGRVGYNRVNHNPRPVIRISGNSTEGFEDSMKIVDFTSGLAYSKLVVSDANADYTVTTLTGTHAIDYLYYELNNNGTIYFRGGYGGSKYPVAIPYYDTILASYTVRMFSNAEMNDALYQALLYINAFPGSEKYPSLIATPYYYEQPLITIATYFLLRRLMMRLTNRETYMLFGDLGDTPGGAGFTAGIEMLKTMFQAYKDQIEDARKGAAYAKYPTIKTYTTETFQLPGSRSYLFRSMFFKAGAYG